jgi:dTDP-4-dehydrorhamnose 3,5-epimerase
MCIKGVSVPFRFPEEPIFVASKSLKDNRGEFNKFPTGMIPEGFPIFDIFQTTSVKSVIRGIHVQVEECASNRMLIVIEGDIFDVTLDLRFKKEPAPTTWKLSSKNLGVLFIPKGFGHGFQAISSKVVLMYLADKPHCVDHDTGVHHKSVGIRWPIDSPIVSERDDQLAPYQQFCEELPSENVN